MKTSYKKAFEFERVALAYLNSNKNETPLSLALDYVSNQFGQAKVDYEKVRTKIKRKYVSLDPNGNILRDQYREYCFTPEKEEKLEIELEEMFEDETKVDFDPEYVEDLPEGLHKEFRKYFTGFVIEPELTPAEQLKQNI